MDRNRYPLFFGIAFFPFLCIFLASLGFLFGLSVGAWEGWLALAGTLFVMWLWNSMEFRKNALLFLCILIASIVFSGLFIFCDSYDSTICHRPAVVLLANGYNPIWQPTIEAMQEKLQLDFTGISLKHIVYQPKGAWLYGAVMFRMTGIVTSDLGLAFLLFWSLYGCSIRFCQSFWPQNKWYLRHLFAIVLLAMPKINQITTGQVDNTLYALTVVLTFSLFLYLKQRQHLDLCVAAICVLCILSIKISGIPLVLVIGGISSLVYFYNAPQGSRKIKLRKWGSFVLGIFLLILVLDASPYITNSINFGGPFYPAHSFMKKYQLKNADLTNDFVGNEDGEKMGFVGRVAYAYFSKSLTCAYYRLKLHQKSFSPTFGVAEGCDGFKTVFRFVMVLGCVCWLLSRRSYVDFAILVLFLSAIFFPIKYIGYARYATQIWCVPFLMIVNWMMNGRCIFNGKWWHRFSIILGTGILLVYALMVLGRFGLVSFYILRESELCMKSLLELENAREILMVTSQPEPKWNADSTGVSFSHVGPVLPYRAMISNLLPGALSERMIYRSVTGNLPLPLRKDQRLFLIQHGWILKEGLASEYEARNKVQAPTSLSSIQTVPYVQTIMDLPQYLAWNLKTRVHSIGRTYPWNLRA